MTTIQGVYQKESASPFSNGQWTFGANGIGVDVSRNTGAMMINELARSNVSVQDISASASLGGTFQPVQVCIDGVTSTINVLVED
jgi:hypothetical protein